MKRPNLFIVGEPKSGTTAMHSFLSQHPEIFMSEPKEPHHFEADFQAEGKGCKGYRKHFRYLDEDKYLGLFKKAGGYKVIGESSTDYLYSKAAAKRIASFSPAAKILIMLREPVDFLYSLHSEYLFHMTEDITDFWKALEAEKERKQGKRIPKNAPYPSYLFYSERIKYADHIKRYLDHFPKKNIMSILFEDFRKDNLGAYQKVLRFLEVDASFTPEFETINQQRKVRHQKTKSVIDTTLYPAAKKLVPKALYRKLSSVYRNVVFDYEPRSPLDTALESKLKRSFRPEVEKTQKLIKKDLIKIWGY